VPDLRKTPRSAVRRKKDRGGHDRAVVDAILDEAFICHVGFSTDGRPSVLPTAYARVGDVLYLHGAAGNHMLRTLAAGGEACVTVTLVDGLVLARSAFHHSINYRCVVLFGSATPVLDEEEKRAALDAIVEHLVPGRSAEARGATAAELRSTLVVRFPIDEGAAKVRTGGPIDDEADLELPVWAGVIPLALQAGPPAADAAAAPVPLPASVRGYSSTRARSSGKTFDTLPSK
jgi:nitroimidazol reductase NimA-like FMN-containing flavoprotein (pyridoxamine 5'-phosphate oxidase superfamily)